jgi:hypothetical protein
LVDSCLPLNFRSIRKAREAFAERIQLHP